MRAERGQASVEWTAAVLVVALALGAAIAVVPVIDGRSFGAWLGRQILCVLHDRCAGDGVAALESAYGRRDAALVRRFAPNIVYEPGERTLPIDFRRCQLHSCSDAPDDPSLDVARSDSGTPATAFTHVVHRGGETFIQYWFYYPDSPSTFLGSHEVLKHLPGGDPADHTHDWEGYQVRVLADGRAVVRATSHHAYQGCKEIQCKNRWIAWTGWTRVSMGSHAGHIPYESLWDVDPVRRRGPARRRLLGYRALYPGHDLHERTTSAAALQLVPLETMPIPAYGID